MLAEPECYKRDCIHLTGIINDGVDGDPEAGERVACRAFPDGIPQNIAYGDNKHLEKVKGQTGDFVYTKRET